MFRSIRFRLALWYTLVVAFTFALISGVIYFYISKTLARSLDYAILTEANWVANRAALATPTPGSRELMRREILEHTSFFPIKEYVEVWDSAGTLLYRSPNLGSDTLISYATFRSSEPGVIETVTQFRNHDLRLTLHKDRATITVLAMPIENILQPVRQLANILVWLAPAVLLIAIAVGMGLAKTSFSKVNKIIETAQNITAERLHDRIPEQKTQDEIGRIITTFNAMISRLDVSFNQMKQFSADASHELRTPLAVMRTELERALTSEATMDDVKRVAANCLDETLRMTNITEDLLFLSRTDAGQEIVKRERVRLDLIVKETYEETVIIASSRSIVVSLNAVDEATILGEESRLRRMLLNLVDNAVKYNHDHGSIGIGLTTGNGEATIVITDSGIGIPKEDVPRIFDRFYRVDRARSRELGGSGLGLSIVYWIVEAHGGRITVKSDLHKGSEFSVTFPLAPENNEGRSPSLSRL